MAHGWCENDQDLAEPLLAGGQYGVGFSEAPHC